MKTEHGRKGKCSGNQYIYTEPQKKRRPKQVQFSVLLYLYNEIVYMCNDKILVQR